MKEKVYIEIPKVPQWWDSSKKYDIQGDIKTLLGRNWEIS